ncbi:MAG TPA: CheR family methyltransferase [Gemmatimonadales bacterium]
MIAALTPAPVVPLTDEAYHLLSEFLDEELGMHFPEHRRQILESRLQQRLRVFQLKSFMHYYVLVRTDAKRELRELARAITNNETYLFRETAQFEALFGEGRDVLRSSLAVPGELRILSAGCSSGEEAFTLNMWATDLMQGPDRPAVRIDAFDIDPDRVDIARRGECRRRSLRELTPAQVARYLIDHGNDTFSVKPAYREGIAFRIGNIIDLPSFRRALPYDVVFCRNVLIYFSSNALRRAINNVVSVLRPGGLLFLGHSESIIGMFPQLETVRLGRCIAYRKVSR